MRIPYRPPYVPKSTLNHPDDPRCDTPRRAPSGAGSRRQSARQNTGRRDHGGSMAGGTDEDGATSERDSESGPPLARVVAAGAGVEEGEGRGVRTRELLYRIGVDGNIWLSE